MSVPHEVWQHVELLVSQRAPKNGRFRNLRGAESKPAVIRGATARLFAVDALFPYALRKRMNPRRVGNITLRSIEPLAWLAWLQVWRGHVLSGEFFDETSEAVDKLVDRAVDAERGSYCAATADSGGPSDGKLDTELSENLSRLTEVGQAFATEPTRAIEQQNHVDAYDAAVEQRQLEKAEEFSKLIPALNAYARKLRCPKQRRAFGLICTEPNMLGKDIALRCRISEGTVSKRRADFEEMAARFLDLYTPPEEVSGADASPAAVPHDETVSQIADAGEIEGVEVDATPTAVGLSLGSATVHSDALDIAWNLRAPDVDDDVSEAVMRGYARQKSSGAYMADNWSGGRRRYSDAELITGSRYGGRWDDPAKIAERSGGSQHASKFSDAQLRELRQKGVAAGVAVNSFLKAIDAFIEKRAAESVDSLLGASIRGPKAGNR